MDENQAILWDWRKYFSKNNLALGASDVREGKVVDFECDPEGRWARYNSPTGFHARVLRAPVTYEEYRKYIAWPNLLQGRGAKGPMAFDQFYCCDCVQGQGGVRCRHLAALMVKWEQVHGPFEMYEDPEARAARIKAEQARQEAERIRKEQQRLREEKEKTKLSAVEYLLSGVEPAPKGLFFPIDQLLRAAKAQTNQYEVEAAARLLASGAPIELSMDVDFEGSYHKQTLRAVARCGDETVRIATTKDALYALSCTCGHSALHDYASWYTPSCAMCCHALMVWPLLREKIIRENPGDTTDYSGMRFLSLLSGDAAAPERAAPSAEIPREKRKIIDLLPRINRDRGNSALKLTFDIGCAGERRYSVKSLEKLVEAVEEEKHFEAAKALNIDFNAETFTDEGSDWYQMIQSRVRSVRSVNARLNTSRYYYSSTLSVGTGIPLEESDLDIVYDMAEGGEILYQYGQRSEVCAVRVGAAHPQATLTLEPVKAGKRLTGIAVRGEMPRLLRGSLHRYILDRQCFGRVQDDDLAFLSGMQSLSEDGSFECTLGEKRFAEFYYRALPALQNNPQIHIVDRVGGLIEGYVPPEARFTFHLDLIGPRVTCMTTVAYGDAAFPLSEAPPEGVQRDMDQEKRVTAVLKQFFPHVDDARGTLWSLADDDLLPWILTDGVDTLSRYGEVLGSEAFKRVTVQPAPQPRVSVQVAGGLLDLSIRTRDLSEEELLALLASYRLRKRWHRLSSGDFVDLSDAAALSELSDTALAMDTTLEELIRGGVRLPKYRALYVERLLEDHQDIATARDKGFKALVRSFRTIKDSDFDPPEALTDVLRPYQLYGFRWLSTLSQAGFGGILADEMGLGKTVQTLAFIQAQKERGEARPALVVCPASLVYNWKDECRRFVPGLRAETLAGTLGRRKEMLKALDADLFITSYDLMKRDITLYGDIEFSTIVLDEAQYIKNQKAAVSKAVRVLKGEHRIALTGTPIENRLSELWSIFDFLMPGFLYTAAEFTARFETPIMKQKDADATAKLARMTEPFILRRKKTDVLKELPEKLEETRSSEMDGDQRKVYDAQVVRMKALLESAGDSGEDKLRILAEITRLRQICCDPSLLFSDYRGTSAKREACLDLIQSAMDAGHRMLVFSQFTSMLALLEADLKAAKIPYFLLTGATPKQERLRLVNAFNDGDTPVFLISLKAGGTGLNLTGADVVIHYDPWWNLAAQNQATDRAHRIGQTRQVTVVKLIAADTIEERILRLQQTKHDLAEAIITGQNTSLMSLSREDLLALVE